MFRALILGLAIHALALPGSAQDIRMGGPISGVVYDEPSRSVRPILGMPGAARLGEPILSEVDWATIAPNGRSAIVYQHNENRYYPNILNGVDDPSAAPVIGIGSLARLSEWSADSTAVALFSDSDRTVQWVRLTGQGAVADPAISIASIEGDVTALTADRPSGSIAIAVAGSGVYRARASDGVTLLLPLADVPALRMTPDGQALLIADRTGARVLRIPISGADKEPLPLVTDTERLADVSALALSSDGTQLYLASRATQRLYSFDLSTSALSESAVLDTEARSLTPLGRPTLFLLGQRAKRGVPLYILDMASGPGIYFVPAGEEQ